MNATNRAKQQSTKQSRWKKIVLSIYIALVVNWLVSAFFIFPETLRGPMIAILLPFSIFGLVLQLLWHRRVLSLRPESIAATSDDLPRRKD